LPCGECGTAAPSFPDIDPMDGEVRERHRSPCRPVWARCPRRFILQLEEAKMAARKRAKKAAKKRRKAKKSTAKKATKKRRRKKAAKKK